MLLKRGIDKGVEAVVEDLKRLSKPVNTAEETAQVAAVSSGDESIGQMISEVMSTAAEDGVITVEESQGLRLEQEYVEGMQIDHGYVSAADQRYRAYADVWQPVPPERLQAAAPAWGGKCCVIRSSTSAG